MGQWSVDVDEDANRLYAELSGFFEEAEARESTDAIVEAADRLDDGFAMITDLTDLQIGDPDAADQLERGKRGVAERGVATVVRIPPAATSSEHQYAEAGEDAEDYDVETAASVADAEELLDER